MIRTQKTLLIVSITFILLISISVFIYLYITREKDSNIINEDCITWFDGCNTCTIDEDGITVCTERYCYPEDYEEPKCLDYDDVSEKSYEDNYVSGQIMIKFKDNTDFSEVGRIMEEFDLEMRDDSEGRLRLNHFIVVNTAEGKEIDLNLLNELPEIEHAEEDRMMQIQ
jgi:hypothetical protein